MPTFNQKDIVEEFQQNKKSYAKTAVIFLDLSKAFDCVSHEILLEIVDIYGIRGTAYDVLQSYLDNREQSVEIAYMDGKIMRMASSKKMKVPVNVPQGSVMGPFLFNIYTNGLKKVIEEAGGEVIIYVDDTNIIVTADTVEELNSKANAIVKIVYEYFSSLKLALNLEKTVYMTFNKTEELDIELNNSKINQVESTKFLGVEIDCRLKWSTHLIKLSKKLDRGIFILSQLKQSLTLSQCMKVYFAHFYSHLSYCTVVWGDERINKGACLNIFRKQKKAIRLLAYKSTVT